MMVLHMEFLYILSINKFLQKAFCNGKFITLLERSIGQIFYFIDLIEGRTMKIIFLCTIKQMLCLYLCLL